jgi:hypothetical protein
MMLDTQTTTYPVADYLAMLERGEVTINKTYQRSAGIWSIAARSFLVETVLKNLPIPKLSLHQKTDPTTLMPHKDVVDGQQRTYALRDFREGKFRLSSRIDTEEWHGLAFEDLSSEDRRQFLNYGLSFDLLIGAEDEEVREIFRRMNTFTVALNYEEQRNAAFNGRLKWFIRDLTNEYADALLEAGAFKERGFLRMADAKLMTELAHAYFNGIATTNSRSLDKVYRDNDQDFEAEEDLGQRLRKGLDFALSFEIFHDGPLFAKTYEFYAFVLAAMHVDEPVEPLEEQIELEQPPELNPDEQLEENLGMLESALTADEEEDEVPSRFEPFVEASATRTNVRDQRIARTQWFCDALTKTFD